MMKQLLTLPNLRRLLSLALCVLMLTGLVPQAQAAAFVRREADASTLNDWEAYFGDDVHTSAYAGSVWTDKSVYADAAALNADLELKNGSAQVAVSDPDHFLVALSAISSSKSITAHSTIPVDVVFVLDMSGSMGQKRYDANDTVDQETTARIEYMIEPLNSAITTLMELNAENRVGVVLYYGVKDAIASSSNESSFVLMGLDRYLPSGKDYVQLERVDPKKATSDNHVYPFQLNTVATSETTGNKINRSFRIHNFATYLQSGLLRAWYDVYDHADITVPADGDSLQAGVRRMPVMVLMSDGAPTATTSDFTNLNVNSNGGNSRTATTSPSMGFAVQLTASWVRTQMQKHYNSDGEGHNPLVYTMGVELDSDTSGRVAESVLNPMDRASNTVAKTIDGYWNDYLSKNGITLSFQKPNALNDVMHDLTLSYNAEAVNQNYVNQYFPVQRASEMNDAFGKIVHEIVLQSLYFPTRADSGTPEHDGYVTFIDDIGDYMVFDKLNGIVLMNQLYSGAEFADQLASMGFAKADGAELGSEFIRSGMTRLGITEADAKALVENAVSDGQLYYSSSSDFGNSIGWYADQNGKYLAPWKQDGSGKPSGAAYICHSYCFLENGWEKGENKNLLYVSVQVREEIATGKASVIWRVPATMIPLVQNEFTIADLLNPDSEITRTHTHATPIRLIYEVGLRDDITEHTVDALVGRDSRFYDAQTGLYTFHTNLFDEAEMDTLADSTTAQPHSAPQQYQNTISYFVPNLRNERYFFEKDSLIYQKNGSAYQPYRGSKPAAGQELYTAYTVFDWNGTVKSTDLYYQLSDETIGEAVQVGESWYVPRGTVRRSTNDAVAEKSMGDQISPITYANFPFVLEDEADQKHSCVASVLGNNGVVSLKPVEVTAPVEARKQVHYHKWTGYNPAGFEFELVEVNAAGQVIGEPQSALSGADGSFGFELPMYTSTDLGLHYYQLTETLGEMPWMIYTEAKFLLTVDVCYSANGELQALTSWQTVDGEFAEDGVPLFINVFDPPLTGDNTQLMLLMMLCMISAAAFVGLWRWKRS